jgi:Flp pilus assembly protein TadD
LGKHQSAIEVYDAALMHTPNDWQLYYGKALSYATLRNNEEAIKCARKALSFHRHESM